MRQAKIIGVDYKSNHFGESINSRTSVFRMVNALLS